MFQQRRVQHGFQHADGSLIYPGIWVETYVLIAPGCWMLIAFQPEELQIA